MEHGKVSMRFDRTEDAARIRVVLPFQTERPLRRQRVGCMAAAGGCVVRAGRQGWRLGYVASSRTWLWLGKTSLLQACCVAVVV